MRLLTKVALLVKEDQPSGVLRHGWAAPSPRLAIGQGDHTCAPPSPAQQGSARLWASVADGQQDSSVETNGEVWQKRMPQTALGY